MSTPVKKYKLKKSTESLVLHDAAIATWGVEKTYLTSNEVSYHLHGKASKPAPHRSTSSRLIEAIQQGLPIKVLDDLQSRLIMSIEKLAPMLGISKATLHRRKIEGRLGRDESDHVIRFARLFGKAVEVFESEEAARGWLKSPQVGLGGAVPLDFAETEIGAREVEDLLGRIEYGVYS